MLTSASLGKEFPGVKTRSRPAALRGHPGHSWSVSSFSPSDSPKQHVVLPDLPGPSQVMSTCASVSVSGWLDALFMPSSTSLLRETPDFPAPLSGACGWPGVQLFFQRESSLFQKGSISLPGIVRLSAA